MGSGTKNLSRFWNKGQKFEYKNGISDGKRNIPRYDPVKFVSKVRDFDHRNFDGISITAEFSIFVSF